MSTVADPQKTYSYTKQDPQKLAQWWFQTAPEGLVLFAVFYTQACRWNRCLGCNLPSKSSAEPVVLKDLAAQIDELFALPEVIERHEEIEKVIVSNNGSMLDEKTFQSTALMYLVAHLHLKLPNLKIVSLESRVEYIDWEELVFLDRALKEGASPIDLEISIGFEVFDDRIRNEVFGKGLTREKFEEAVRMVGQHNLDLKCYFMQKPVPEMTDEEAVEDIRQAIRWLDRLALEHDVTINMHLNPTYVASGTPLETAFKEGRYTPPKLGDVARAVLASEGRRFSVYIGLSDEGLAIPGGSFLRDEDKHWVERLDAFNRTQDYDLLKG